MLLVQIPRGGDVSLPGIILSGPALGVIAPTVQLYERRGYAEPWVGYLAIEGDNCVGACGFTSPPVEKSVEIAYCTFPEFEKCGVATRMAQRLIAIAQECDKSVTITAHTLTEESASTHILGKLGFVFSGLVDHAEDGKIWKWSYESK